MTLLTADFVHEILQAEIPYADIHVADREYTIPDIELYKVAHREHIAWLKREIGDARWVEETFDCDDFAKTYDGFASLQNKITSTKHPELNIRALPAGQIWYHLDEGGGHAINVGLYKKGRGVDVCFIEPQELPVENHQEGGIVKLSRKEKEGIWLCVI